MVLFSEIYGCYYQVVAEILRKASETPLKQRELEKMIEEQAYGESVLAILPKLMKGQWAILTKDGAGFTAKASLPEQLPLTYLQRAWLKAILQDRRMQLFLTKSQRTLADELLKDIEPLYRQADLYYFDAYSDGDDYDSALYQQNFHSVMAALEKQQLIKVSFSNRRGQRPRVVYLPYRMEYSAKDDKFRLHAARMQHGHVASMDIINIGRLLEVSVLQERCTEPIDWQQLLQAGRCVEPVIFTIFNERNALERCMLHFANYEKRTEYDEVSGRYICAIYYHQKDETELLIRILSFGPVIKVLGPEPFLQQIRARVKKQWQLSHEE